jgi:nitrate reductase NapAB chaperone NapD
MNISSAIVIARDKNNKALIEALKAIEGCDVPLHEDQKLIVSIEAENISAETGIMRKIENTPGVISVKLVFAYSEHELEQEMKKVEEAPDFPEWLNDETSAKDIPYSGKLKM